MNINDYLNPGKSVNVVAAAGTGKTWFIISKILRLLLDEVEPEKITAITFTKKTTAEMRNRLNEKIEYWSNCEDKDIVKDLKQIGIKNNFTKYVKKAKRIFLTIQLSTRDIRISTFDSFFLEILNQMHFDKDIPKSIDTNLHPKLIAKDIEEEIFSNNYLEKNPYIQDNINFLMGYIGSFHTIKESIIDITSKKSYFLEIHKNLDYEKDDYENKVSRVMSYKKNLIENIIRNFNNNYILKNKYKNTYNKLLSSETSLDNKVIFITDFFLTKSQRSPRLKVKKDFEKLNSNIEYFISDIYKFEENIYYEIQKSWKLLAITFFNKYQKSLKSKDWHDYSDNTWLCFNKLSDLDSDNWIYYKIANSINHLLIDEFQDTNYLQWQIILKILNAINNLSSSNSVTIVGDSNQSIYGFRGSEPRLFDLCRKYTKENFGSEDIYLNESRRSSKEIINFVNGIFSEHKDFFTKIDVPGSVEIEDIKETADTHLIAEANTIALQIENLINNKNIKYKDIIILSRNRTHIDELEKKLIEKKIPVITDKKRSILEYKEIIDIYNLLKYLILDEHNVFELFSLLKSPIFNYTINEINQYNINDFFEIEKLIIESSHNKNFIKWKSLLGSIPMHDILDIIYHDLDIINLYCGDNYLKNKEIKNNFLNFLNLSLNFNNGRYISPFQFLHQLENIRDIPDSYNYPIENAVRILTIHSAKGLEAEVIILAQTFLKKNNNKSKLIPIFNQDLSCDDVHLYIPKIFKNSKNIEEKFLLPLREKETCEEKNLLYVACTRAKRVLIANGFDNKKYDGSWFSNSLFSQ